MRRKRLHRPWKVPIHMPRVLIGSMAEMRVTISRAALLVKVTARIVAGLAFPVWISQAIRVVSTRVLPLPAPARISAGWFGSVTAASCSGLRCSRSDIGRAAKARFYFSAAAAQPRVTRKNAGLGPRFSVSPFFGIERAGSAADLVLGDLALVLESRRDRLGVRLAREA